MTKSISGGQFFTDGDPNEKLSFAQNSCRNGRDGRSDSKEFPAVSKTNVTNSPLTGERVVIIFLT